MTKILINSKGSGFGLSNEAILFYAHLKGLNIALYKEMEDGRFKIYKKEVGKSLSDYDSHFCILPVGEIFAEVVEHDFAWLNYFDPDHYDFGEGFQFRSDPYLLETIDALGRLAGSEYSDFKVVEIPDDVKWHIFEREDGSEIIMENSRSWS